MSQVVLDSRGRPRSTSKREARFVTRAERRTGSTGAIIILTPMETAITAGITDRRLQRTTERAIARRADAAARRYGAVSLLDSTGKTLTYYSRDDVAALRKWKRSAAGKAQTLAARKTAGWP